MTKPKPGRAAGQPVIKAEDLGYSGEVTADFLRRVVSYDEKTGAFTWLVRVANKTRAGEQAGGVHNNGYHVIALLRRNYKAHRLAWLYVYGKWPEKFIDHIDGNRANNAITNLREADFRLNVENQRAARSDNSNGFLGVTLIHGKYSARINVHGRRLYLGVYKTPEEAHTAYIQAKRVHHKGNTL